MKILSQILCLCSVLFLTACDYVIPSTWNYRITVEIETPEGIKTGSAVRQVRAWKNLARWLNPDVRSISYEVIGEAVVVDLGERGVLFFLVGSNDQVQRAFSKEIPRMDNIAQISALKVGRKADLTGIHTFVTFDDISDLGTIRSLKSSNFLQNFNSKVELKGVTIEITNDPIIFGKVHKVLEWLDRKPVGLNFADPKVKDPAKYLTKSSFIRGEK